MHTNTQLNIKIPLFTLNLPLIDDEFDQEPDFFINFILAHSTSEEKN